MGKHTHKGNCQVCGRLQAVTKKGNIANHGYDVDGFRHMHVGTCQGSQKKPLQEERLYADEQIAYNNYCIDILCPRALANVSSYMPKFYRVKKGGSVFGRVMSDISNYIGMPSWKVQITELSIEDAIGYFRPTITNEDALIERERNIRKREIEDEIKYRKRYNDALQKMIDELYGTLLIPNE